MTYSFRPYHGPGVDSAPSENEYQKQFLGVKAAGAWGWRLHHVHVPNVMKIWEPKPPGTLWATPGLLRDSFTFYKLHRMYLWCQGFLRGRRREQITFTAVEIQMNFAGKPRKLKQCNYAGSIYVSISLQEERTINRSISCCCTQPKCGVSVSLHSHILIQRRAATIIWDSGSRKCRMCYWSDLPIVNFATPYV